jgi:hypothetical protein
MVNVIVYSTDNVNTDLLKKFTCDKYTPITYGEINKKYNYVYGNYNIEMEIEKKSDPKRYHGNEAIIYMAKRCATSGCLLKLDAIFGNFINKKNTDIEVEGLGNGSFIRFVSDIVKRGKMENKKFYCLDCSTVYIH